MRETTRAAVVAVLAISALAFAAATLDSTVTTGGSGPDGPGGGGGGGDGGLVPPPSDPPHVEAGQLPFLTEVLAVLAAIAALAILVYLFFYWRKALKTVLVVAVLVGLLFLLAQVLAALDLQLTGPPGSGSGGLFGGGGGGSSERTAPSPLLLVVLFAFGLALVGAVVALLRTTDEEAPATEDAAEPDAVAVGRAAGRAADRLEADVDVDNEVYRAWREMTDLLDVPDPDTSTPGEFADAAVEAGLGRADVGELTRLFEDVRYGEEQPSAEHERRAVAIFRRIEDRYAEDDA